MTAIFATSLPLPSNPPLQDLELQNRSSTMRVQASGPIMLLFSALTLALEQPSIGNTNVTSPLAVSTTTHPYPSNLVYPNLNAELNDTCQAFSSDEDFPRVGKTGTYGHIAVYKHNGGESIPWLIRLKHSGPINERNRKMLTLSSTGGLSTDSISDGKKNGDVSHAHALAMGLGMVFGVFGMMF